MSKQDPHPSSFSSVQPSNPISSSSSSIPSPINPPTGTSSVLSNPFPSLSSLIWPRSIDIVPSISGGDCNHISKNLV